ncbi:MAG: glutaredoxin family protein [Myxococcales bacterium]|nr:glutaredoxin family protein [Myxococcales bacterium]
MSTPPRESQEPRRCLRHGIALKPDGECLVCRREAMGPRSHIWNHIGLGHLIVLGFVTLVGIVGGITYLTSLDSAPRAPSAALSPAAGQPARREPADDEANKGNIHLEEETPPGQEPAPAEEGDSPSAAPTDEDIARARERVLVTLYSGNQCTACGEARLYLRSKRIEHVERNIDESPSAAADRDRLNPTKSLPTLEVGEETLPEFTPELFEAALDRQARLLL